MTKAKEETFAIVPAQPGFSCIRSWPEMTPADYNDSLLDPIVAWRLETRVDQHGEWKTQTQPITLDGCQNSGVVLRPDGVVDEMYVQVFPNVRSYIHAVMSRRAKS